MNYLNFNVSSLLLQCVLGIVARDFNVPEEHLPYYANSYGYCTTKEDCAANQLKNGRCWGYEKECDRAQSFSSMVCPDDHKGWVNSKVEQIETFYKQADFGYVRAKQETLMSLCKEKAESESSMLTCSENLEFCTGRNIMIDFSDLLHRETPVRYSLDVLKPGQISGNCRLDHVLLKKNMAFVGPLQSWAPELKFFSENSNFSQQCDEWVMKPTIITKIDASVNMYHHFCDFFNLYVSQHVNNTVHSLSTDNQVIIWETYPYRSNFGVTWKAFSRNPIWNLQNVKGKKMCFKNLMLPLLSRMIFGLYYNTPIIWGCEKSGLFRAFSQHILHRLGVAKAQRNDKIHVTILSRTTKFRRTINEDDLIRALQRNPKLLVRKVRFSHGEPFLNQLHQDQWTDILIGMHGSGLTHSLFLPDWAAVFEIYNCGDPDCYKDLVRLRGLKYFTWEKPETIKFVEEGRHPGGEKHLKFSNYEFDETEFVRIVNEAIEYVQQHPAWLRITNTQKQKEEL